MLSFEEKKTLVMSRLNISTKKINFRTHPYFRQFLDKDLPNFSEMGWIQIISETDATRKSRFYAALLK